MNATLLRAVLALVPTLALLAVSLIRFTRTKSTGSLLQLLGAAFLVVVVLAHICEGLGLLPWMRWGRPHSIGHYVDLASAVLGVALVPLGYVLARARGRRLTCA
jgi:hypothetical protein